MIWFKFFFFFSRKNVAFKIVDLLCRFNAYRTASLDWNLSSFCIMLFPFVHKFEIGLENTRKKYI